MRVFFGCTLLLLSALGIAFGQDQNQNQNIDTNFATGPQYLNYGSPLFARPISTPSLSLTAPPLEVGSSNATHGLVAGAEDQTVSPPQPDSRPAVDLFAIFYGAPPASVIEISFPEASAASSSPQELPASILDTGVWQTTTAQALRDRGYEVTLPEAAAYGKTHTRRAIHVYTNADIDRLHRAS
jgi:hypothetical protein